MMTFQFLGHGHQSHYLHVNWYSDNISYCNELKKNNNIDLLLVLKVG